jgi:amidase
MATSTGLAMSWDEWHQHDALALAERVRAKEVTAKELSAQAADAIARLDPMIEAVLGIYEDAVADPDRDSPSKTGQL